MLRTYAYWEVNVQQVAVFASCKSLSTTPLTTYACSAPLRAGIMPIMTYGGFKRMTTLCKTKVPQKINDTLESIKDNDEAVKVREACHAGLCG